MANLFVYGTLMDPSRLYEITGKCYSTSPAHLRDFKKLPSRFGYPYIVRRRGSKVKGLLIRDIDEQALKRLDVYENEARLYFRKKVQVVSAGEEVRCETYVGNPDLLRQRA